jgi:hypothetical protein
MIRAEPCICGKHMLEAQNENVCVWCGHGIPNAVAELAYRRNMVAVDAALERRLFAIDGGRQARGVAWPRERCVSAALAWRDTHGRMPRRTDWERKGSGRPTTQTVLARFGTWVAFMRELADIPLDFRAVFRAVTR